MAIAFSSPGAITCQMAFEFDQCCYYIEHTYSNLDLTEEEKKEILTKVLHTALQLDQDKNRAPQVFSTNQLSGNLHNNGKFHIVNVTILPV